MIQVADRSTDAGVSCCTLKEAEALKDEFVGIAAHELRTPLAALKGYADMLLLQTRRGHGSSLADWQQEALEEYANQSV